MKPYRRILIGLSLLAAMIFIASSLLTPGSGRSLKSPDGKYEATAWNAQRYTLLRGKVDSIDIKIVDTQSGYIIWHSERYPVRGETLPRYRGSKPDSIVWAPDSKSVTIDAGGSVETTWSVP